MAPKRTIKAKDIINDVRKGMTDSELMDKYRLSAKGLQSIFRKLEAANAVRPSELYGRFPSLDDSVEVDPVRREFREYLDLSVPIYEVDHPEKIGSVRDISTKGIGARGIRASPGDVKSLVINPVNLFSIDPFVFEAVCRWARRDGPDRDYVGAFEITDISEDSAARLRDLISKIALRDGS